MAKRRRHPWWWRSEVLGRIAMALLVIVTAGYLARLFTLFVWSYLMQ
jgi:fructose-specific phosphotransferase system IIC component